MLLTWVDYLVSPRATGEFRVSATRVDGYVRWTWRLSRPPWDILAVEVSADGARILVVERDGRTHVLGAEDGQEIAALQVQIGNTDTDEVTMTANGRYVAVKRRTPSGVAARVGDVYPVVSAAKREYGTEGRVVHLSPYHDLLIGLREDGMDVVGPSGKVGVIPLSGDVQGAGAVFVSSADGSQILVFLKGQGLVAYDRSGKQLYKVPLAEFSAETYAPVGQVVWHQSASGKQEIVRRGSVIETVGFDAKLVDPRQVMPAGERVFRAVVDGKTLECIVRSDATVRGCFSRFSLGRATSQGAPSTGRSRTGSSLGSGK